MTFDFSKNEQEILNFWQKNNIFEKSIKQRDEHQSYVFYDGPPFATGLPHYGHLVASITKDVVPRYWTMKGYYIERKWGWDCHGLPIENLVEQELKIKSKKDIEVLGVKEFNNQCRSKVLFYGEEWKKVIQRIGRWVDMEHPYSTMDLDYMESVLWVFRQLWDKGLIYEGYRSLHYCPRCGTVLSNFEVAQGYQEVEDESVTVKFPLKNFPQTYLLAWTTTAWTLPGNVALAVGYNIKYVKVKIGSEYFIVAKDRLSSLETDGQLTEGNFEIVEEKLGQDLIGLEYQPPFDYFYLKPNLPFKENGWKVYGADFVANEEGTGIVHIASAFGEDDLKLGQEKQLPFIQHVDEEGRFISDVSDWPHEEVKPKENPGVTDKKIIDWLRQHGKLFATKKIIHSYPFCWRCDSPLLNYATSSWFVRVESIKNDLIENNQKIHWVPEHVKEGRFGKWLEEARDWTISRSRYWGAPIPIWRCQNKDCNHQLAVGSLAELEQLSGKKITDLHKPMIDEIVIPCPKCQSEMKRVPEVFDCWFESGSMPYAQFHYPFERKEWWEQNFPAQFISEGIDQTRGWFYTLLVLSVALFNKPAYYNVLVHGIVLAEDGQKMSKKLKNYPEPLDIVDKYGADALRLYLLTSPIMKAEDLHFSEKGVNECLQNILLTLYNVFAFYKLYATSSIPQIPTQLTVLDKWILSRLQSLIEDVDTGMKDYDLVKAVRAIAEFIDDLSKWYLRRSRARFKDSNSEQSVALLGYILLELSKISAPFIPFISEYLYQNLKSDQDFLSVHLEDFPRQNKDYQDKELEHDMAETRKIVSLILAKRIDANIKVRQPLSGVKIKTPLTSRDYADDLLALIKEEANIKKVIVDSGITSEVELDTTLTPELIAEGWQREIIRKIQSQRKILGLMPQDKAQVKIITVDLNIKKLVEQNLDIIKQETNSSMITISVGSEVSDHQEDAGIKIEIQKI